MILKGLSIVKKIGISAVITASALATVPFASAQQAATPSPKVQLLHAFRFVGFDTAGITFDLPSDPSYNTDNANFKYHLYLTSQFDGTVVAFSNNQAAIKDLANASILLYEVGQVRNVTAGATATNP